jgi:hypothetical protein
MTNVEGSPNDEIRKSDAMTPAHSRAGSAHSESFAK